MLIIYQRLILGCFLLLISLNNILKLHFQIYIRFAFVFEVVLISFQIQYFFPN